MSRMQRVSASCSVHACVHNVRSSIKLYCVHIPTHTPIHTGCRTLLATHFHQLTDLGDQLPNIGCYCLVAEKDDRGLVFTYQIRVSGGTS